MVMKRIWIRRSLCAVIVLALVFSLGAASAFAARNDSGAGNIGASSSGVNTSYIEKVREVISTNFTVDDISSYGKAVDILSAFEEYLSYGEEYLETLTITQYEELVKFINAVNALIAEKYPEMIIISGDSVSAEGETPLLNDETAALPHVLNEEFEAYLLMSEEEQKEYRKGLSEEEMEKLLAYLELIKAYNEYLEMSEEEQEEFLESLSENDLLVFKGLAADKEALKKAEEEKEAEGTGSQEEPEPGEDLLSGNTPENEQEISAPAESEHTPGYTVEYYYDGIPDGRKTEVISASRGDVITGYPDKNIAGFMLEMTEGLPLVISGDPAESVIRVYYVRMVSSCAVDITEVSVNGMSVAVAGGKIGYTAGLGDEIRYSVTVMNTGNVPLEDLMLGNLLSGNTADHACTVGTLGVGEIASADFSYTVMQDDIDSNRVISNAAAAWFGDGQDPCYSDPVNLTVKFDPVLGIEKTADKESDVGVGDVITYTIGVENTGNVTLYDVYVVDNVEKGSGKLNVYDDLNLGTLFVGDKREIVADYTVTQSDVDAQEKIINRAYVSGKIPGAFGNTVTPGSVKAETMPEKISPALKVTITADKDRDVEKNDYINYTLSVTNVGNATVKDIVISDPLFQRESLIKGSLSLAPGKTKTLSGLQYKVTGDDVGNDVIRREVEVFGYDPAGNVLPVAADAAESFVKKTQDGPLQEEEEASGSSAEMLSCDVRHVDMSSGEILATEPQAEIAGSAENAEKAFVGYTFDHAETSGLNPVLGKNEVVTLYYKPVEVSLVTHYVDGESGRLLAGDSVLQADYGKEFTIASRQISGYEAETTNILVPGLTNPVNELSINYYKSSSSAQKASAGRTEKWGVLVDKGDELGYSIEEIEEEKVPLAYREQTHGDVFFPFFCMMLALFVELYYMKKRRDYQKEIYELRAKLLGTSLRKRG
ncbi:MAG: MucBP domain-containing protein [Eubacteriales bacterium]|nr:MucBP domain-containing protein [Eubacteriales bacterium]